MEKHLERPIEPKRMNKIRIAKFISSRGVTSKTEISGSLKISMPTTLQNVKELMEAGVVVEEGEYESTGGRKAKALSINQKAGYALGVDITRNHITTVIVNARKEILASDRIRVPYRNESDYYEEMLRHIFEFSGKQKINKEKIMGIGFSLPGFVNREQKVLTSSHVLKVKNVSFKNLETLLHVPYELDNDANSAAFAELGNTAGNEVYLSLSNTVGGAVYFDRKLYRGENFKSGEFGHMIIERNGRTCYCGKKGCADAYCSASILQEHGDGSLEGFFDKLRSRQKEATEVWEEYLEYLAIVITNLRMFFDCKIVLGGYVGGYLDEFMPDLAKKVMEYNKFDLDTSYLSTGKYKLEAAAYGATLGFIEDFLEKV